MNTALALQLPVPAAFRIVNDPTVQDRLFGDCSWFCCQSWAVWMALATLMMYCVRRFFNLGTSVTAVRCRMRLCLF